MILCPVADNTRTDLRLWRKRNIGTQEDIAKTLGIARGYYATLESGNQATPDHIEEKLKELGFGKSESDGRRVSIVFGPMAKVPVVGRVAAGDGETNVDPDEYDVWVPSSLQQIGGIGYVIDGDSMMPCLESGDIALFRKMSDARNGFTFLLKKEGQFRCKNISWKNGGWVLESLNPDKSRYPDEPLGSWQILGILVGWYRSIGSYEKLEANPHGLKLEIPI